MHRNKVAWAALAVSLAALASSQFAAKPLPATQDIPDAGQRTARELSVAFNAVAEYVRPSVVQINVEKGPRARMRGQRPGPDGAPDRGDAEPVDPKEMEEMLRRFFGPDGGKFQFDRQQLDGGGGIGTGSGFVLDDKGHILTNNHVVEGATKIVVTFHDGATSPGRIVGNYPDADVAVIQVEETSYKPVRIGTSKDLHVGDWVLAFGSPFGLTQTVTAGIISATERDNLGINRFESFLQTDASINPGNSGGPLVDIQGRVIGINSAIATMTRASAGVGFAIPIDMAIRLANKLILKGKIDPALMGIVVEPINRGLARQLGLPARTVGVVVLSIGKESPAANAGLQVGDIITSFDGMPVRTREGLQYLVYTSDAGESYPVEYLRGGQTFATTVKPASMESVARGMNNRERPPVAARAEPVSAEVNAFGIAVTPLTPELADRYEYKDQDNGLVVTTVKPGSVAEESGMEVGDLITRYVKDRKIVAATSVEEFNALADSADEIAVYLEDVNHRLPGEFKTLIRPEAKK